LENALWFYARRLPIEWGWLVTSSLIEWWSCGVFVPALVVATRRLPLERPHLRTRVPVHLVLILLAVLGKTALVHLVRHYVPEPAPRTFAMRLMGDGITEGIAFGAVAGLLHAAEYWRRYRDRDALSAELQARLSDAQLRALRAQLNPHFLFNTLNAAAALVHRDPGAADAMLTTLGELLRHTLCSEPEHESTLREELALLERYLSIMRIRFAGRVDVALDVDPGLLDTLVPTFVLQPLVENAFEHGVARLQSIGQVTIGAAADGDGLVLSVRDNGPGPRSAGAARGVGLSNTRARLAALYGPDGRLTLDAHPGGGAVVRVQLPLRRGEAAA
jgi:two-component system, LytTR family, sensor kinase